MNEDKLKVVANLIKTHTNSYTLSVRWVLGELDTSSELPKLGDVFHLTVRTREDRYLRVDGTLSAVGDKTTFTAKPKYYAMVDPPRRKVQVPGQPELFQRVADKPTSPVAKDDIEEIELSQNEKKKQLKLGKGLGVLHLLEQVDPSVNIKDATRLIEERLQIMAASLPTGEDGFSTLRNDSNFRSQFAKRLASYLVSTGLKPSESIAPIVDLYKELAVMASQELAFETSTADFFSSLIAHAPIVQEFGIGDLSSIAELYESVAMAMDVMTDPGTVRSLENVTYTPDQVRKQLKIQAFQGGSLIDFWASPDVDGGVGNETDRGHHYSASDLLGLGLDIEPIPAETIEEIQSDVANNFLMIELSDANGSYGISSTILHPQDITNAKTLGAAFTPNKPKRAFVNYDLTMQDSVYPKESERNLKAEEPRFVTGNGMVELHIEPTNPSEVPRDSNGEVISTDQRVATEAGFNIYGIWENSPGMDKYFTNPETIPSIDELQPYLITRRYSYERDIFGAFPDVIGATHPGVVEALANPPWHSVIPRPRRGLDYDEHEDTGTKSRNDAVEVPDLLYRNDDGQDPTIFSFDIRRGLIPTHTGPAGAVVGWDPAAEVDDEWTPLHNRDGSTSSGRPEYYRFFVSSVNCFDQESDIVPVVGADLNAVQDGPRRWIFTPAYRSQIQAPENLELFVGKGTPPKKLLVQWNTPDHNENPGVAKLLGEFKAQGHELSARLRLYRRRLTKPVEAEKDLDLAYFIDADDPNWAGFSFQMSRRGWKEVHDVVCTAPTSGITWTKEFTLDYSDLGFEYIAAANLHLPEKAQPYWSPATVSRTLAFVHRGENGELIPSERVIADAPTSSMVASVSSVMIPNEDKPRAAVASRLSGILAEATPVYPLPGIQRDLVLARIIGMSDGKAPSKPWSDTGISLSYGQKASAEAALIRTLDALRKVTGDSDLEVSDPSLTIVRQIISSRFQQLSNDTNSSFSHLEIGQNLSIGFRGILRLQWHYEAHASRPPLGDIEDAEATSFEIFQVRMPLNPTEAENKSNFQAQAEVTATGFKLSLPSTNTLDPGELAEFNDMLSALKDQKVPKLAIFQEDSTDVLLAAIVENVTVSGTTADVTAKPIGNNLGTGKGGRIRIFFGMSLATVKTQGLDSIDQTLQEVFLPIGGGEREIGCWWAIPRSAQNQHGEYSRWAIHTAILEPTIEPEALGHLDVYSAVDRAVELLDPQIYRDWIPSDIHDMADALSNSRIILRWNQPADHSLNVVIERERKRAVQSPEPPSFLMDRDFEQWKIIRQIQEMSDDEEILPEDINVLSEGPGAWMLGNRIKVEPDEASAPNVLINADKELSAKDGLLLLTGSDSSLPAFIDYWDEIDNPTAAMDGQFLYRYRLRLARAINGSAIINNSGLSENFLYSPPTPWSEWILPESPPIIVNHQKPISEFSTDVYSPRIDFVLTSNPRLKSQARSRRPLRDDTREVYSDISFEDDLDWKYRVVIRRVLGVVSPGEDGSQFSVILRDVGIPIELGPENTRMVTDWNIERDFADDVLKLQYEIFVQQISIRKLDGKRVEQPVRSHTSEPQGRIEIELQAPGPNEAGKEIHLTQKILIK